MDRTINTLSYKQWKSQALESPCIYYSFHCQRSLRQPEQTLCRQEFWTRARHILDSPRLLLVHLSSANALCHPAASLSAPSTNTVVFWPGGTLHLTARAHSCRLGHSAIYCCTYNTKYLKIIQGLKRDDLFTCSFFEILKGQLTKNIPV